MSEPAWKKAGLALKRQQAEPEKGAEPEKKRAKKEKKPRAQRKQESVESHWAYCDTFVNNREAWKFSKQQQNWLLKHVELIPEEKEDVVFAYLKTVQGGSKERLVKDTQETVERWNTQRKEREEAEAEAAREAETDANTQANGGKSKKVKADRKPAFLPVDADHAMRSRNLHLALTEVRLPLLGLDETTLVEEDVDVEKYVE